MQDDQSDELEARRQHYEKLLRAEVRLMPKFLYKYRAGNADDLSALEQRKVWFPSFARLVDEYDGKLRPKIELAVRWRNLVQFPMHGPHGEVQFIPFALVMEGPTGPVEPTPEQKAELDGFVDQLMTFAAAVGCYSLCADGQSHRMWKEYGADFSGYCIEYDWRMDPETVELRDSRTLAVDTQYFDELPQHDYGLLRLESRDIVLNKLFRPKLRRYEFEKEWRILTRQGERLCPEPGPISAITFGDKTPDEVKQRIRHVFREHPSIVFRRARALGDETVEIVAD
ncbi:hypothetical protein HNQ60_000702 [Povalibacter uvarum]|uniref:DUF2971 domain-containing protein n=1 Tax=Povalibacter uvarum TaxID=732238 RepID=A0A841HGF9_9GAMM|nr:DUF2971 domain-containing protein [Povalibacter uvarum]MBB6091856.1 hypothetical protein [Povalibacter uvarum]